MLFRVKFASRTHMRFPAFFAPWEGGASFAVAVFHSDCIFCVFRPNMPKKRATGAWRCAAGISCERAGVYQSINRSARRQQTLCRRSVGFGGLLCSRFGGVLVFTFVHYNLILQGNDARCIPYEYLIRVYSRPCNRWLVA